MPAVPVRDLETMKHKAHLAHRTHGRMRMKIPSAQGNQALFDHYRQVFSALPGVESVDTRPDTGSIVLHYDPRQRMEFECSLYDCCEQHHIVPPHAHPHHHHHHQSHHDERPGDEIEHMARRIQAEAEYLASHSHSAKVLVDFFKDMDRQIKVSTNNAIDLKIVLAAGLTALTILEIGAHAATPMWVTLAIFGLNHFAELHHQQHQQHGMAIATSAR
jgi:hypothetical protein